MPRLAPVTSATRPSRLSCMAGDANEPPADGARGGHGGPDGRSTSCVWVTLATGRPASSVTVVSTTTVVEPTCRGRAVAVTVPDRTAPRKFVFDSTVVVSVPAGRLSQAQAPPA